MVLFDENCLYFTRSQVDSEVISPKYPCMRCKFGFTGSLVDLTTPESFPSATHQDCQTSIASCDSDFPDLQGADIRYDVNVIHKTNFLNQKLFSCVKCLNDKIPVATIFHDSNNKAFYYKKHDSVTFDTNTITSEGVSVACRNPSLSEEFGLTAGDSSFDLDPNCSLAVIDLSQTKAGPTKTESRYAFYLLTQALFTAWLANRGTLPKRRSQMTPASTS